ncbi:MAG: hypothetical protein LBO09_00730 [Candidatus Peribacteria bacterium]|jgi:hypothetical protein|nr:hypothetical protein [Candidatus Peribacteria bacterium]
MLFWIWHHCYYYGNSREKLERYLISLPFVGSERHVQFLEKAYSVQRKLHHHNYDIYQTLLLFEMAKNLPTTLESPEVEQCVKEGLGEGFSLQALSTVNKTEYGHAEGRWGKEVNTQEEPFKEDFFEGRTTYASSSINGKKKYIKVARRDKNDLHQDFSGKEYAIYLDGPFGIGLFQGKTPLATLSFSLKDENTLFIHQIQAVSASYFDRYGRTKRQGVETITHTLPWKETLYQVAVLLAKKYHCRGIELIS